MDESGIGKEDDFVVVCGVIIDIDKQSEAIEAHLDILVRKHIPADKQKDFFFHAAEIFSGASKSIYADKTEWPAERRWKILDDLVEIPKKFDIPVCVAWTKKSAFPQTLAKAGVAEGEIGFPLLVAMHGTAIAACEMVVEKWMREKTAGEFALITMENNNEVKKAAKAAHLHMKGYALEEESGDKEGFPVHLYAPFVKIKDGLQFAEKAETRFLQIADVCAWTCRRALNKAAHSDRFITPLMSQIFDGKEGQ